jgi:hypothetical protein
LLPRFIGLSRELVERDGFIHDQITRWTTTALLTWIRLGVTAMPPS